MAGRSESAVTRSRRLPIRRLTIRRPLAAPGVPLWFYIGIVGGLAVLVAFFLVATISHLVSEIPPVQAVRDADRDADVVATAGPIVVVSRPRLRRRSWPGSSG